MTTYRVECEDGADRTEFAGLSYDRAVERCECERGKALWATVLIRVESSGEVFSRYHGAGRVPVGQGG